MFTKIFISLGWEIEKKLLIIEGLEINVKKIDFRNKENTLRIRK